MGAKVSFPRIGVYTEFLADFVRDLGIDVLVPPKITKETIKLGVRHSPEMICFPYKVCIGNLIQCLEQGANTIAWPDTQGTCRFTHFSDIQTKVLKDLGYKFDVLLLRRDRIFYDLKKMNPDLNYLSLLRKLRKNFRLIKELEDRHYHFEKDVDKINVGIVGEIYTVHEPAINHNIIELLRSMDVNVDVAFKISDFVRKNIHMDFSMRSEKKQSRDFLEKDIGGHARESIYNTLYYINNGFDGVIHLMPLTCMPETTIQPILDIISRRYSFPVYSFAIDENNSEAGFKTRLETFISILKQRRLRCAI